MEVVTPRSQIDTSRPFHSVRDAVEVFGGAAVSRASSSPSSSSLLLQGCLKKLEEELAEARSELLQLKQWKSQMDMALSSITVQLAVADAAPAMVAEDGDRRVGSDRWVERLEYLPSLSEALTIKMVEEDLGERRKVKNVKKKKKSATLSSLVGSFFSKKDKVQVNNLTVPRKR